MSKILVIGASGFIGTNILRAALNKGFEIRVFIRKLLFLTQPRIIPK